MDNKTEDLFNNLFPININDTFTINSTSANSTDDGDPFWIILMDRSQLVMTLIGVIANIGTSITLIKNKQVCKYKRFDNNSIPAMSDGCHKH